MHGEVVVGDPVSDGVLAELVPAPEAGCAADSARRRLALWIVFPHVSHLHPPEIAGLHVLTHQLEVVEELTLMLREMGDHVQ